MLSWILFKFNCGHWLEKKAKKDDLHIFCQYRKNGRLRALGYYAGTGLHLGVGDTNPNTWGKACN